MDGRQSRLRFLSVHPQSPRTCRSGRVVECDGDLPDALGNSSIYGSPGHDVGWGGLLVEGAKDVNVCALLFLDDVEKMGVSQETQEVL